jgi:beta-lactamase regulating signal transducer with metallopeptidase domain
VNTTIEILNHWAEQAFSFAWPMLWQSSLLIGVLFALDCLLRRRVRAAVLYALWLSVLVKLLLPPSLALPSGISYWLRPSAQAPAVHRGLVVSFGTDNLPFFPPRSLPVSPNSWQPTPSTAAWGLVVSSCTSLGLLGWMLVQWRQVTRDTRRAAAVPCRLNELLEEARHSVGVGFSVRVRIIDRAVSPAVCGLFRPIILLPRTLVDQLTGTQMRAILLHELIHLRRGDVWVNCVQALLQIVYWWHPLLWLANARMRQAREEAVDDAVMQKLRNDADTYAPTLLQVAKLVLHRPLTSLGLVGILESHSSLRRRIERLIDFRPPQKAGLTIASALCVLAFGALALPMGQAPVTETRSETSLTPLSAAPVSPLAVSPEPRSPGADGPKAREAALVQNAKILFEMGKLDEAEKTLKEVVEKDPSNQAAFYYMGLIRESRIKHDQSNDVAGSEPRFIPNYYSRTNLIHHGKARGVLITKLHTIRFDRVQFDNLPLTAVVRFLTDQTRKLDPTQQGISFAIGARSINPDAGSARLELGDFSAVQIRILPALSDVRLVDVLDAIVKVADKPIQYSIEDYGVVFAWKAKESPPLYTRMIKVNPDIFSQGLESVLGGSLIRPGGSQSKQELAREFFETMGVDLNPPKSAIFNEREGTLLIHGTLEDLDRIEAAVQVLNIAPPQVNIKVRFFEVPEEFAGPVWRLLNPTNQPADTASGLTAMLTPPKCSVFLKAMESNSGVKFLNECTVTTLSGRQVEVQFVDLKTIATNINPRALKPPGVSARPEGGGGVYLEGQIPFGPILDAVATAQLSSNQWKIQLNATASMTELSYYERTNHVRVYIDGKRQSVPFAQPHFRTRKIPGSAIVYDGQTLVLGTRTDEPLPSTPSTGDKRKRLLTVITPTIIDPAGNRLHGEADLLSK